MVRIGNISFDIVRTFVQVPSPTGGCGKRSASLPRWLHEAPADFQQKRDLAFTQDCSLYAPAKFSQKRDDASAQDSETESLVSFPDMPKYVDTSKCHIKGSIAMLEDDAAWWNRFAEPSHHHNPSLISTAPSLADACEEEDLSQDVELEAEQQGNKKKFGCKPRPCKGKRNRLRKRWETFEAKILADPFDFDESILLKPELGVQMNFRMGLLQLLTQTRAARVQQQVERWQHEALRVPGFCHHL